MSTRTLQQSNVKPQKKQGLVNGKNLSIRNGGLTPINNNMQNQEESVIKRPSPILKKISSFDSVDVEESNGSLDYQSPLRKDGLIMDPPTPLFFSFSYGLYSDNKREDEELSTSSCCSTVDDPSPPSVTESKRKKKVTFAVPEAITFTEKEVLPPAPSPKNLRSSPSWKNQGSPKFNRIAPEGCVDLPNATEKKRCAWITPQSDPAYIDYHDTEWGVPVHDDKKLFELLVFSGAQAELSWSAILSKREHYRTAFCGFDPEIVSKFDEAKISSLAADPEILQHEGKLRQIVDNAKCIVEVVQEFGSLDKYMWNFLSQKPIVNRYKTPQQVPIKSAKSDYMSRELMKRGFRFVGPTIMYSFMQAAGMTNDHIIHCFRHHECVSLSETCRVSSPGKVSADGSQEHSSNKEEYFASTDGT